MVDAEDMKDWLGVSRIDVNQADKGGFTPL